LGRGSCAAAGTAHEIDVIKVIERELAKK